MFDEEPDGDPHGECAAEINRLGRLIRECAKDLINVVRMPNAEYVADTHNAAVQKLRNEAGLK